MVPDRRLHCGFSFDNSDTGFSIALFAQKTEAREMKKSPLLGHFPFFEGRAWVAFCSVARAIGVLRFLPLLASLLTFSSMAATFPGNADLTISDGDGVLSWNAPALTVQWWFKISIPSGTNLTSNMAILVNQTTGSDGSSSPGAFLFRFNIYNGCVEFVTQGNSGGYTNTLIRQPYLERWYLNPA